MNTDDRQLLIARSQFREAHDAFFLFDPSTWAVIDVNSSAMRLTGLEKRAACTISAAWHGGRRAAFRRQAGRVNIARSEGAAPAGRGQ